MSRISHFHHEHMCVCKFVFVIVSHFVSYFSLFGCMQKRNEKKGESEKKYYEGKTHVSGDWFMSVIWRHKHWGVTTRISHTPYLSILSMSF